MWVMALTLLLGGLQACSGVPRIVVLHDPLTPEEHVTLAASYEGQGLTEMAAREYQAALHQRSDFVPALIGFGNLSFESGALQEAEDSYRRALEAAPDHPGAGNNLAMVYLSRGERLDEAERLAGKALEQAGPLRPYVLDTLTRIYARTGRYREAEAALAEAEAVAPSENKMLLERLARSKQELVALDSRTP